VPFTFYIYIIFILNFSLNKIHLQMYQMCISIRSCSQTRPGICSQTRPGISLCSFFGLSLQGRGQFLVLLNQSEQDQESLSVLALDCLCQTGLTPWSVSLPFHRTILLFLLLCKILFPGPVGALLWAPFVIFFATFFGLFGLCGTLWNRFCTIFDQFWSKQRKTTRKKDG